MKLAAPFKGQFVVDLDYLVDQRSIEIFGDKPGSDPLDPMLAGLSATDHRGLLGLDGYGLEIRIEFLVALGRVQTSPYSSSAPDLQRRPVGASVFSPKTEVTSVALPCNTSNVSFQPCEEVCLLGTLFPHVNGSNIILLLAALLFHC